MRVMRVVLLVSLLSAPVGIRLAPVGGATPAAAMELRDLRVQSAVGDGSFICAKWCGLLESCC
jgi:hypothetical protein